MPDDTPDQPTPVPEPVLAGYVISALTVILAAVGVNTTDEWYVDVLVPIAAAAVTAVSAYVTRNRVTPEVTAKTRIEEAKAEVVAEVQPGTMFLPSHGTSTLNSSIGPADVPYVDREWMAPRFVAAPPATATTGPLEPDDAGHP